MNVTDVVVHSDNRLNEPGPGDLHRFFQPQSIAVVGASDRPGSVGNAVFTNLACGQFAGNVYPVNPKRATVGGRQSHKSVLDISESVDLAVIAAPAIHVPDIVRECGMAGLKSVIILSAGFGECGDDGTDIEKLVLREAQLAGVRIIGPNCLGLIRPSSGLNASFSTTPILSGTVGFVSQSGALCTALLDWSVEERFGFSAVVSVGAMLDVDWADLVSYLADDPLTSSIVLYIESIGNGQKFVEAARKAARTKPIIALKSGRSEAGVRAAHSHTGALASNDAVLDAAFEAAGVVRVNRLADLFNVAEALASQPRTKGRRVAVLTNAGGAGVLAADALVEGGSELAVLSYETLHGLEQILPSQWSHGNPVDVLGDSDPERYAQAADIVSRDLNVDGLLLLLTPQSMTDPTRTAETTVSRIKRSKPVLAAWMGGKSVEGGRAVLQKAGIPSYAFADTAARVFNHMVRAEPSKPDDLAQHSTCENSSSSKELVRQLLLDAACQNRTLVDFSTSMQILSAYGIPGLINVTASTVHEAVEHAGRIGFPVALKLNSSSVTHKSDVGGVCLNISDPRHVVLAYNEMRERVTGACGPDAFEGVIVQPMLTDPGYETILGSVVDPQFGPVLMFGSGGTLVEILDDRVLALPPLTICQAHSLIERTRIYRALSGYRGRPPVDLDSLANILVRFSNLIAEQPGIAEIDINPLWVGTQGALAVDARMILCPRASDECRA